MKNLSRLPLTLVCMICVFAVARGASTLDCNFEDAKLCGYTQDSTDNFDWTWFSGPTSSHDTGPSNDHTFGSSRGHYMYIEATPLGPGHIGLLISPTYTPLSTPQCLEFWYHMHGEDIGSLRVYFQRGGQSGSAQFSIQGNKGNSWYLAQISINANAQSFQLIIEGTSTGSYRGDIGIDDIVVKSWGCGGKPAGPDQATLNPPQTNRVIQEYDYLTVSCACGNCVPSCNVQWKFGSLSIDNSSSLRLSNVSRSSGGRYTCTCTNPASLTSASAYLDLSVRYGPDDVALTPSNTTYTLLEFSTIPPVICNCGLCDPRCTTQWYFKGTLIKTGNNGTLELTALTRDSAGQYICTCLNPSTSKEDRNDFILNVLYGPDNTTLIPATETYTRHELSPLPSIACFCGTCNPMCNIEWTVNGTYISNDSILTLGNVTRNTTGQYACTCTNPSTQKVETQHFNLSVWYGPDTANLIPATETYTRQELSSMPPIACFCGECNPECRVEWTVNGTYISNDSILTLGKIDRNTTGHYVCTCTNPSTQNVTTQHFNLSIRYGPDQVVFTPANTNYTVQESFLIPPVACDCGSCEPRCTSLWTFNGIVVSNDNSGILDLGTITRNAAGLYVCTCTNPATLTNETRQFNVNVFYGPDAAFMTPTNKFYNVEEGSSVTEITCACRNCEPRCLTQWIAGGKVIANTSSLQISNVSRADSGTYTCQCLNPSTKKEEKTELKISVNHGPDEVELTPGNITYTLFEFSSLPPVTCDCGMCEPRCKTHWSFKGTLINSSDSDTLELQALTRDSAGQYICTCLNPSTLKSETKQINVHVLYGPDAANLIPATETYTQQEQSSMPPIACFCGECNPDCRVEWTVNGTYISNDSILTLEKIDRNTTGHYVCTCTNPSTQNNATQYFNLSIRYGPDQVVFTPANTSFTVQESFLIPPVACDCGLCEPRCTSLWTFNGIVVSNDNNGILDLGTVTRNATGHYVCTCTNPATLTNETRQFNVNVFYGPDAAFMTPTNKSYNVEEGSSVLEITCACGNCEPRCLTQWLAGGEVIGNTSSLQISNVSRADSRTYTCQCLNPSTMIEEKSELKISVNHGPVDVRIQPDGTSYIKTVGSELQTINCTCGNCMPTCKAEWIRNGVTMSQNSILYFKRLSEGDSGQYTCTCVNPITLKTESKQINLVVNALPNIQPCPDDTDAWDTTWEETSAGEMVTKNCIGNEYTGSITRVCTTTGRWLIPKYNCIRSSFADVENALKKNASQSDVNDALNKLVDLTNTRENNTEMYSGEIESATRTLDAFAELAKGGLPPTEEQSKSFMKIASNLLGEDKKRSWESLSQSEAGDGGSKLLQSVDSLSEAMTKSLEDTNTTVVTIIQPNIVLEARKVDISQDKIRYPMAPHPERKNEFSGAKLSLPLPDGSASKYKSYTVTIYRSLAGVLPDRSASRDGDEVVGKVKLNSRVVSLQTFPYRSELDKPLILIFDHEQPHFRSAECSYWSFLENQWATHGCHVKSSDGTKTVCECYHLTNFAVLMSPWSEPVADSTAIEIISIVGCSISIVCLIVTAALHLSLWRYIKNDRAIILINICAALLATYVIFLSGINQTDNKAACTAVAALLHYILLVVFCLMLAEGIEITITVKFVFVKKSRIKWMIPLAWGIPAIIVGLSMGITQTNGYGTENFCWLAVDGGVIWAFVGPALVVIVANIVFLAILLRTMLKTKAYMEMSDIERIKCSARCLCVLVPLMGCTWVLGIFYVNDRSSWIQYLFALCNSLQGFFIFLFHGLLNKQLRTAIKSRHKKYKDSHSVSRSHGVSKSQSTRRTEVTCAINPVYSSAVPIESKSNPVKKYGRKLSLQFMKTGSYSPMNQEK